MEMTILKDFQKSIIDFDCENTEINKYFKEKALDDFDAVPFVFTNQDSPIIAMASLSCSSIIFEIHNKLSLYPAVEIKMFAVNKVFQHKKYPEYDYSENWSTHCLDKLINHIYTFTENHCGASRIVLYSVPDAVSFYEKNGFKHFEEFMRPQDKLYLEGCTPLYMTL